MTREDVLSKLSEIIRNELHIGENINIAFETKLDEIGMDSIALMSLLVYSEEYFNFEAGEDILISEEITALDNIVDYILNRIQKK